MIGIAFTLLFVVAWFLSNWYWYSTGYDDGHLDTLRNVAMAIKTHVKVLEVERSKAKPVIVSDKDTDCATGHCECGACHEPIDPWDRYCRHCGAEMEGGDQA